MLQFRNLQKLEGKMTKNEENISKLMDNDRIKLALESSQKELRAEEGYRNIFSEGALANTIALKSELKNY